MNRTARPLLLTGIALTLFAGGAGAEIDPRLRGCYDTFLQCIDQVPEHGTDGRYPLAREQACETAYERCRVRFGFPPSATTPNGAQLPTNPVED